MTTSDHRALACVLAWIGADRAAAPVPAPEERSSRQPMHGPRRRQLPAVLAVVALVVAIVLLFALITWIA